MVQGMRLDLIDMREDGWWVCALSLPEALLGNPGLTSSRVRRCIVRKRPHKREYWVPGNYITVDGRCDSGCSLQGIGFGVRVIGWLSGSWTCWSLWRLRR
eukprot:775794-Rhodomonas_salina.1